MPRPLWRKAPTVLLHHGSVLAAVLAASALVALAAAGGPLLRAAVESEALKAKLADLSPVGAGLTIETRPSKGDAGSDAARRRAAYSVARTLPYARTPIVATTTFARVGARWAGGGRQPEVVPMARDGAMAHVHRLAGGGGGAWVAQSVAAVGHLRPGDGFDLEVDTFAGPLAKHRLRVGAVYLTLEADQDNPYWLNYAPRIRNRNPDRPPLPTFLLVDRPALYAIARDVGEGYLANTYEFPVETDAITPARARELAAAYADTRRMLRRGTAQAKALGCEPRRGQPCTASSSLEAAVTLAVRNVEALSPVIGLLAAFASLIAIASAVVAGGFNTRRREGEARLSVVRGERRATYALRTALEALAPVAVGTALGLLGAAGLVRALAPEGTVDDRVIARAVGGAIVGALVALAAVTVGSWAARGPTVERRRKLYLRVVPWELVVLVLAAVDYLTVRGGGGLVQNEAIGSHPRLVVLLFPLLLAAAAAGLLARVAQRALRGARSGSNVVFLALRRLAAARGLLVLLVVTTAVAFAAVTFAEVLDRSLATNSRQKAFVANGSDVQGLIDPQQEFPASFPVPIARVVESFDTVAVDGSAVEAIVTDPRALRDAIRWEWADDPRPALDRLAASDAPLPALAGPGLGRPTRITIAGRPVPVEIVGTVDAFPGALAHKPLIVLPTDQVQRAASAAGVRGDPFGDAITFVWAKGDAPRVTRLLAASELAPEYTTTVDYFLDNAALSTAKRAYGFIRLVAFAAALVALAALVLYLYARSRVQRVTAGFLERMDFGAPRQAASVAAESALLTAFAALAGGLAGLAGSAPLVERVDPLPQYAPSASLVVPWPLLGASFFVLVLVAGVVGGLAGALAGRGDVAKGLRVA